MSTPDRELIPPPQVIRAELARSVREARRLRALLRLSEKAQEDHRFITDLAKQAPRSEADGRGVGR